MVDKSAAEKVDWSADWSVAKWAEKMVANSASKKVASLADWKAGMMAVHWVYLLAETKAVETAAELVGHWAVQLEQN